MEITIYIGTFKPFDPSVLCVTSPGGHTLPFFRAHTQYRDVNYMSHVYTAKVDTDDFLSQDTINALGYDKVQKRFKKVLSDQACRVSGKKFELVWNTAIYDTYANEKDLAKIANALDLYYDPEEPSTEAELLSDLELLKHDLALALGLQGTFHKRLGLTIEPEYMRSLTITELAKEQRTGTGHA